jgi:hypothetical protein
MQLIKLGLIFGAGIFFFGRNFQITYAQSQQTSQVLTQPTIPRPLFAAIEELRVMKIKIEGEGGISQKEYGEDLADLVNIVNKAQGNAKGLAAVKSAVKGHQLALQFWRCDRTTGYEESYQCRDKVLKEVFAKYPDIKAQAMAAVAGENLSHISAGLDKDAVLQAIWIKTGEDTGVAVGVVNPISNLNEGQGEQEE